MRIGGLVKRSVSLLCPQAAIVNGRRDGSSIALTFDDGPHPENTPRILDALDAKGVRATFFVIAEVAAKHPGLLRETHARGHQIANHGFRHLNARKTNASRVVADVLDAQALLEDILGSAIRRDFRPPYGAANLASGAMLAQRGYRFVFWSVDSRDAFTTTTSETVEEIARARVQPGDIVLLHDDYARTVDALPKIVAMLQSTGLGFDRVDAFGSVKLDSESAEGASYEGHAVSRPGSGKRALAAQVAVKIGALHAFRRLRTMGPGALRVLAYHRVLPYVPERDYPYDLDLVSAWQREFEWQLDYLREHYRFVSTGEVASALQGGLPLPSDAVMLTFDDGFSDNFEVAFPALRARGLPAIIFLTTGYIGERRTFWFDRLTYIINRTPRNEIRLPGLETVSLGSSRLQRSFATEQILRHVKTIPDQQRMEHLANLEEQLLVDIDPRHLRLSQPLTWEQIREMSRCGIEFGSHSVTHPVLSKVSDDNVLRAEIVDSKHHIELECGREVVSISYPVGGPEAIDQRVLETVRVAGYKLGFTYSTGLNVPPFANPLLLRRLRVERYTTRASFAAMLEAPSVFA